MAGSGSRFKDSAYSVPKPFIPVLGRPMFMHALRSIDGLPYSLIVFIVQKEHTKFFDINESLRNAGIPNYKVIELNGVTEGQLSTVLTGRELLRTEEDILILSSDTYVESDLSFDIKNRKPDCSGIISVAEMPGDQWSFARVNENGEVDRVAEKERISSLASTGLYYFSNGNNFLKYSDEIIKNKEKTRDEYYVIPVYQKFINAGEKISVSVARKVWDMGTPSALDEYCKFNR